MRVALLSWETLHSIVVGGVAPHVTELGAGLQRRGHEVHVYTRSAGGHQPKYEVIDGVHYHRCPVPLHHDFVHFINEMCNSFMWHIGETESFQNAPFDIIHAHDWLAVKAMVQAKNHHKHKVILTMHSTELGRGGGSDNICSIEWEGNFVADRVICVSSQLATEVRHLYRVPEWKVRVIGNGINCHRFDGFIDPAPFKASIGLGPLDPMVLFVGRMFSQKGPDILIEALPSILAAHGNAKVVWVGDGHLRGHVERRAHELGVQGSCRFMGPKSMEELVNFYKAADVVVVPSRNEPFGIVVLEAWAAGKPVVVTKNVGCAVTHGDDGYMVDCTAEGLAWGVAEVFRSWDHARHMGSRGRVKAAFSHSWDSIAEQTERVYDEVNPYSKHISG